MPVVGWILRNKMFSMLQWKSADPSRVYLTERSVLAVQIPRIAFGGIDSIVCVLHKSAISDI